MDYRFLGRTGVRVSNLCLGTMNFGRRTSADEAAEIIGLALSAGINFVDTADAYAAGETEKIVGDALALENRRQNIILATKFNSAQGSDVNAQGVNRRHLINACEASLKRLRTDWIDLYQIHRSNADVPIDETLRALDDLIHDGKVRYIGCSMLPGWRLVESLWIARELGLNRLICEQPAYHLLDRTAEREVIPAALSFGMGIIPWAPLAGGLLTGKYDRDWKSAGRWQAGKDNYNRSVTEAAWNAIDLLREIAAEKGCSVSQLALAWCTAQPGVTAPIIGPRTAGQLEDNLGAVDVELVPEDFARIDQVAPPNSATIRYYDEALSRDFRPSLQRVIL